MQISFEYDRTYFPPFPVLEMSVIGTASQQKQVVTGLIDSGSDATQIPLHVLQAVGARDIDDRWVRDYYGLRRPATIYAVTSTFHSNRVWVRKARDWEIGFLKCLAP